MRQWMVDPRIMCRKHLLGEHVEHHMFIGSLKKGISIEGYIKNNLLQPHSLISRHDVIAEEMVRRGYNHQSPIGIEREDIKKLVHSNLFFWWTIDKEQAREDLLSRCPDCRARVIELLWETTS